MGIFCGLVLCDLIEGLWRIDHTASEVVPVCVTRYYNWNPEKTGFRSLRIICRPCQLGSGGSICQTQ
jgi:hypothetical protein